MSTPCVTCGNDDHHWRDCVDQCVFCLNTHAGYPCRMLPEAYHSDDNEMRAEALANFRKAVEAVDKRLKGLKKESAIVKILEARVEAIKDAVARKAGGPRSPVAVMGEEEGAAVAAVDTKGE